MGKGEGRVRERERVWVRESEGRGEGEGHGGGVAGLSAQIKAMARGSVLIGYSLLSLSVLCHPRPLQLAAAREAVSV